MTNTVIFTDIDGVYNTPRLRKLSKTAINADAVEAVKQIAEKAGAKVVITSSWREDYPTDAKMLGFPLHDDWRTILRPDKVRGLEVQEWLDRHPEVERYAIIDDWDDFLPEQMPHLIHTAKDVGIEPVQLWSLRDILTGGLACPC